MKIYTFVRASMNKKFITLSLILVMTLGFYSINMEASYAISDQELADSLDPTPLENQVVAAKYLLENFPRTVSGKTRTKLERLLVESEKILKDVYDFKQKYGEKSNTNIRVKNQIKANLDKRKEKFVVNVNSYSNNKKLTDWFLETAKEDWYFYYSMYDKANVTTKYNPKKSKGEKVYVDSATYTVSYRENDQSEQMVEEFCDQWIRENISPTDSNYQKALKIHDFIVKKNFYNRGDNKDMSGGYSIHHPSSILFGNGGVCNAYATLFDKLGTKAGLDVRYATGFSKKTGEAHIWNMVKIDGNWFNIDTTWDDPTITFQDGYVENIEDFVSYEYFLKSDEQMKASRTIEEDVNRPKGNSTMDTGLKKSVIREIDGKYRVVND